MREVDLASTTHMMCVRVRDCVKCIDVALSGIRCPSSLQASLIEQLVTMNPQHAMHAYDGLSPPSSTAAAAANS